MENKEGKLLEENTGEKENTWFEKKRDGEKENGCNYWPYGCGRLQFKDEDLEQDRSSNFGISLHIYQEL